MVNLLYIDLSGIIWVMVCALLCVLLLISLLVFIILRIVLAKKDTWVVSEFVLILVSHLALIGLSVSALFLVEVFDHDRSTLSAMDVLSIPLGFISMAGYAGFLIFRGVRFGRNKTISGEI